jgi:hypothetical protein
MNNGALGNFKGLSQDGERADFYENTRASPFKKKPVDWYHFHPDPRGQYR